MERVMLAKAGIQVGLRGSGTSIPAFAGMTSGILTGLACKALSERRGFGG
jgi:hypothetical protein